MLAKGKDDEWHDYNELTRDEQEQWDRGQREADERWERIKNGSIGYVVDSMQYALIASSGNNQRLC